MAAGFFLVMALLVVLAVGLFATVLGSMVATPGRRSPPAAEVSLRDRYAAGSLTREQYQSGLVDLLQERYVRGEIGLDEYEMALDRLLQGPSALRPARGRREHAGSARTGVADRC